MALSSSMSAQSDNASISGVVKDPSGALVAGANIGGNRTIQLGMKLYF